MIYLDRIYELQKQRGISTNKMLIDCKLGNSLLQNWKTGKSKPTSKVLAKIADYFNVSIDYLMGREEPKQITGISIARGGEVRHYEISEERLKYLEVLAKEMEKENKK